MLEIKWSVCKANQTEGHRGEVKQGKALSGCSRDVGLVEVVSVFPFCMGPVLACSFFSLLPYFILTLGIPFIYFVLTLIDIVSLIP